MSMLEKHIKESLDCNLCEYNLYDDNCPGCNFKKAVIRMAKLKDEEFKEKVLMVLGCNDCIEHRCIECKNGAIKEELLKGLLFENLD